MAAAGAHRSMQARGSPGASVLAGSPRDPRDRRFGWFAAEATRIRCPTCRAARPARSTTSKSTHRPSTCSITRTRSRSAVSCHRRSTAGQCRPLLLDAWSSERASPFDNYCRRPTIVRVAARSGNAQNPAPMHAAAPPCMPERQGRCPRACTAPFPWRFCQLCNRTPPHTTNHSNRHLRRRSDYAHRRAIR